MQNEFPGVCFTHYSNYPELKIFPAMGRDPNFW